MISVIIPSYKPGLYFNECLNSLKEQIIDENKFEVIIVLNGDKEPYFSWIKNYIKSNGLTNFKLYYTQDKGVSNARNIGLDYSQGDYICFIDDDDLVTPNYLKSILEFSSTNTIVVTNLLTFDNTVEITKKDYIGKSFEKRIKKNTIYNNRKFLSAIGGKIIPKKIIGEDRFNINFSTGEDSLFLAKISNRIDEINFTDVDVIYYRRIRENSASRRDRYKFKRYINLLQLLKQYINLLMKKGYNKKFIFSRIVAIIIKFFK